MSIAEELAKLTPTNPTNSWTQAYATQPIPEDGDDARADVLNRYLSESRRWRRAFEQQITPGNAAVLTGFAIRACTLAIRMANSRLLELAILAFALAYPKIDDPQERTIGISLPYLSARKLGLNADELYRKAVSALPLGPTRYFFESLPSKLPDNVVPQDIGFRESVDTDGFRWDGIGSSKEDIERYLSWTYGSPLRRLVSVQKSQKFGGGEVSLLEIGIYADLFELQIRLSMLGFPSITQTSRPYWVVEVTDNLERRYEGIYLSQATRPAQKFSATHILTTRCCSNGGLQGVSNHRSTA